MPQTPIKPNGPITLKGILVALSELSPQVFKADICFGLTVWSSTAHTGKTHPGLEVYRGQMLMRLFRLFFVFFKATSKYLKIYNKNKDANPNCSGKDNEASESCKQL